jgi:GNAT superfamily N-acetyltransferase
MHIVDVDLENFHRIPRDCRATVFWEMEREDPQVSARFQKEEWFSSTLLEWGPCGKLLLDGDVVALEEDPPGVGFAEYAPVTLFPRRLEFPSGHAASIGDAIYLAYCYVEEGHRGRGLGTALIRDVARAAVDRGYRAVEAIGDRAWRGGWVIPVTFLAANGFHVVRDDERYPLLRLDLRARMAPLEEQAAAALPVSTPPTSGVG